MNGKFIVLYVLMIAMMASSCNRDEVITDDEMVLLAHEIAKKIESDLEYPGQIKVHVIREKRVADYAK